MFWLDINWDECILNVLCLGVCNLAENCNKYSQESGGPDGEICLEIHAGRVAGLLGHETLSWSKDDDRDALLLLTQSPVQDGEDQHGGAQGGQVRGVRAAGSGQEGRYSFSCQ